MNLKPNIYFVGAGGIGMAALERYFLSRGVKVAGYDRTPTPLTADLCREGVDIVFDDDPSLIPAAMQSAADTLVVYTPAIPDTNRIMQYFRHGGFEMVKRAAVLGTVTRHSRALCFAGTHGKTTTSSMAAHLLHNMPCGCNAFLGGVLRNYGTNFLLHPGAEISVIEADEYDRSFHHLRPHVAVITATDPDHLDIYGTEEAYLESFAHFTELIDPCGTLIVHTGLKLRPRPAEGVRVYTYSRDEGDFHAARIRRHNGTITFDLITPRGTVADISLGVPVEINIENAIAAIAAVMCAANPSHHEIRSSMASFMGPKRRFEFHLREGGHTVIDDYAHHPDELRQSILSVKALYEGTPLTVAFQPHLYSRTRDFAAEFAEALSLADHVVLLPIYPARELPIPGVTSEIIFNRITCSKSHSTLADLPAHIAALNPPLLLTAGAGDIIDTLPQIVKLLKQQ